MPSIAPTPRASVAPTAPPAIHRLLFDAALGEAAPVGGPLCRGALRFGSAYLDNVQLRDGRAARIRALKASDAPSLVAGFERLSSRSRYMRFFRPKYALSPQEVHYLTDVDGEHHYALAAEVATPMGWDGAAVVRIVRLASEPRRADLAVTVVDDYQGLGLGAHLVARALDAAAERGFSEIVADVLDENLSMRRLLAEPSLQARCTRAEDGVRSFTLSLASRQQRLFGA